MLNGHSFLTDVDGGSMCEKNEELKKEDEEKKKKEEEKQKTKW